MNRSILLSCFHSHSPVLLDSRIDLRAFTGALQKWYCDIEGRDGALVSTEQTVHHGEIPEHRACPTSSNPAGKPTSWR